MASPRAHPGASFDPAALRRDFPILASRVHGKPLVYLDSAATSQKPRQVIEAVSRFYAEANANVHRGVHALSVKATDGYEKARDKVCGFIGAGDRREIVFTRGTTEGVNLVAQSWGRPRLAAGDEILLTTMEHHSNIVPWQLLAEQTGAAVRVAPIDDSGALLLDEFARLLGPRTRMVAVSHASNSLGTINPVKRIVELAHAAGAAVLVDGAQATPHFPVNVRELGCDFYVFSSHKMYGPTGVGVLYGRRELLDAMPPWQGGGDMIRSVSFERTTWNDLPYKFEAGTPDIAGVIGLGAAIDYLGGLDPAELAAHEQSLLRHASDALAAVPQVRLLGTARDKVPVVSFVVDGVHPHDLGTILDHEGVAIRTGHHCAQPVMDRFGVPATARASFALYNGPEEIAALVAGVERAIALFGTA